MGPQKGMEVCIPNPTTEMKAEGQLLDKIGSKKTMLTKFAKLRAEGTQNESYSRRLYILNEKQSRYDPLSSCLVDFKGRANLASVKNFQIVESVALGPPEREAKASGPPPQTQQDSEYILQMGKTTEDCFNMDVKYPMSILQAFAVCIARFDAKVKRI